MKNSASIRNSIKLERLKVALMALGDSTSNKMVVAFSGGVDSSLLAKIATDIFGSQAICVTAVSPSLAKRELTHCENIAKKWGLNWMPIETGELDDEKYREKYQRNDKDRCYWCKAALMDAIWEQIYSSEINSDIKNRGIATVKGGCQTKQTKNGHGKTFENGKEKKRRGLQKDLDISPNVMPNILLGVNTDDLSDWRPGIDAAKERGAKFPFLEAELSKQDVREISKELGLETWDKPAEPCLASRIPFGTKVTHDVLAQIDVAETSLKDLGYRNLRVRHHGDTARIEIADEELASVLENRNAIVEAVRAAGYKFVSVDLEGLQTGKFVLKTI